jgi:hypothetical protein
MNVAKKFRDERHEQCNIVVIEDGEEKEMPKFELQLFETKFPLKEKVSKLKNDVLSISLDELKLEKETISYLKLYK